MSDSGASANNPTAGGGAVNVSGAAPLSPRSPEKDRVHWGRLHLIWLIEMAIAEPLLWFFLYKHLPPGAMTSSANGVRFDTIVATMLANAAVAAVIIYFTYALIHWREERADRISDGPPLRSHARVQFWWVFITAGIVIGAFVFGTYELIVPNGAGGGEGPSPIWAPTSGKVLPIQVIGQQWYWTYRYPTFGGFETTQLYVPNHTKIAFHVTSLDVVHDFWAYQLGVKADANPGVDNVAFTFTGHTGRFVYRCDELCGIWHGAMFGSGRVVTQGAFRKWATTTEKKLAPLTRRLPKFAWAYWPSANGTANGGFYPTEDPFYKMFQYEYGYSGRTGILPGVHVKKPSPVTTPTVRTSTARRPRPTAPTAPANTPTGRTPPGAGSKKTEGTSAAPTGTHPAT